MPCTDQFTFNNNSWPEDFSFGFELGIWTNRTKWQSEQNELDWHENEESTQRALEIARYRKAMIELINDVPEEVFELSLRDLVELPRIKKESSVKGKTHKNKPKKIESKQLRSRGMESGGLLLKMFFPVPSPVKKRENGSNSNGNSKSPKPSITSVDKNSEVKFVEKRKQQQQQLNGAQFRRKCPREHLMMKGSANIFLRNICNNFNINI